MKSTIWKTMASDRTFSVEKGDRSVFRWHHHEYCEIFVPTHGRGRTLVGDYSGPVQPGQVYLVGPLVPHAFYTVDQVAVPQRGMKFLVLTASIERLCKSIPELIAPAKLQDRSRRGILFGSGTASKVSGVFNRISDTKDPIHLAILALEIIRILERAKDFKYLTGPRYPTKVNELEYQRINAVTEFLHKNYTRPLCLAAIAEHIHVSPPTLCRLFKRALGKSILEYVTELRISHACNLLTETDRPITAIAMESGYNTLSNFNRMFLRLKQKAPFQFRVNRALNVREVPA
jgi:AraC-like DNA-binding protein